jgi:serine/threonine-protein kinase
MPEITQQLKTALVDRYVIERELGEGGMATVYLAHDVKHERNVALKVLRPELAALIGAERFLAEIKVTANLQHPHILPLHDSGEAEGFLYYVMPFVEGETLREKIAREKQLGIDEAVEITRSVAGALDYAHRQGVIHRDIKPENILMHDDQPTVADFGIALALSHAGGSRLTETGLSIGTPHYMSPEQAMGDRELDARSDVYSLGAMLYEMLAGEPPFTGPTAQAIVAKVITDNAPPVTAARSTAPPHVAASIDKSLQKLPADRFHSAAEFSDALANPAFTMSSLEAVRVAGGRSVTLWNPLSATMTAVATVLLVIAGWALLRPADPKPVVRFTVALEQDQGLYYSGSGNPGRLGITPDGQALVYVGLDSAVPVLTDRFSSSVGSRSWKLWYRPFDELDAVPLPGTERAWAPAVSPDGERVAFLVRDNTAELRVISLTGGPPLTVLSAGVASAASWGPDDKLYFVGESGRVLQRTAVGGGTVEDVLTLDSAGGRFTPSGPRLLPGGRGVIITVAPADMSQPAKHEVRVVELETGTEKVALTGVWGTYARSGHLVYLTSEGTLMAAPFDEGSLELTGRPAALLEGVEVRGEGTTDVTLSASGTLAYTTLGFNVPEDIVWVGRDGNTSDIDPDWVRDIEFEGISLSPDGRRLAVQIFTDNRGDVWVKQLDRGPLSRLTFEGTENGYPTWSPDGRSVVFGSLRDGKWSSWMKRADGTGAEEPLVDLERDVWETHWSRDGEWLVISVDGPPGSDDIVGMRPGVDSVPVPLVASEFDEFEPALSPDSRWLAYVSVESGQPEVYVRPFPNVSDGKWQISTDGGTEPAWSHDSRELYFRSADFQSLMVADMADGPSATSARVLIRLPGENNYEANPRNRLYDVAPDGRFVMIERVGTGDISGSLVIVQNFFEDLKEKVEQ